MQRRSENHPTCIYRAGFGVIRASSETQNSWRSPIPRLTVLV